MTDDPKPLPRVWVPGVCIVEGSTIRVGPTVGWHRRRGIADWKMAARIYVKPDGPSPPESRIDADRYPRLHAVATQCPAAAEPTEDGDAEDAEAPRHLLVVWHRVGGGGALEMRGGGKAPEGFSGEFPGRLRALGPGFTEDDYVDHYTEYDLSSDVTIDAVIRAVSEGRFDEATVELAVELADAAGSPAKMQQWESWLEAVEQRATQQRPEAEALAQFIARTEPIIQAAAEAGEAPATVDVPTYGEVKAHWIPELWMARDDASEPGDDAIRLPQRVELAVPRTGPGVESEWPPPFVLSAPRPAVVGPGRGSRLLVALLLLAVVAAIAVARCS